MVVFLIVTRLVFCSLCLYKKATILTEAHSMDSAMQTSYRPTKLYRPTVAKLQKKVGYLHSVFGVLVLFL